MGQAKSYSGAMMLFFKAILVILMIFEDYLGDCEDYPCVLYWCYNYL